MAEKDIGNTLQGALNELRCVVCTTGISNPLSGGKAEIVCPGCGQVYPLVNNIPVMINEKTSIFTFADFLRYNNLFFDITKKGRFIARVSKLMPSIGGNNLGKRNFRFLEETLLKEIAGRKPRVLVVGGSIVGEGMSDFSRSPNLDIVAGDVSFGPESRIVFDGHDIPYADQSFDCVIVQAVLEHVTNPIRCVSEIHRVLRDTGIVYAETPFMQQVHGGPYDFTRFTRSGHRKLFATFTEIKSGTAAGSGTALAWSYQYFFLSLFGYNRPLRLGIKAFARITGFWMKYLDYITRLNKYDADGASGFFFIGRKSSSAISDREVIAYYSKQ